MGSGWFINGLELPEAPRSESKAINRSFLQESIYKNFPSIFQPTTSTYSYTLTGYIYGDIVTQLEALAKSADTEIVSVITPNTYLKSTELNAGLFAVSNFTISRDKYAVTKSGGRTLLVYDYILVLTEFAEGGVNENSIELETLGGEEFIGIADELGLGLGEIALLPDLYPTIFTDQGRVT